MKKINIPQTKSSGVFLITVKNSNYHFNCFEKYYL
jgi:hypothetical protein